MTRNLDFNVSARTARLIGLENFANAEGAIVELVKNAYDADSSTCFVVFDLHDSLTESCLYVIDNGQGMTEDVIVNHWMTIGTDDKLLHATSAKKLRVKSGAKGIGRFALNRLGKKTTMLTFPDGENGTGYSWVVDWHGLEHVKVLSQFKAELTDFHIENIGEKVAEYGLKTCPELHALLNENFHGTILRISDLNDNWDEDALKGLQNNLEILFPEHMKSVFSLFMYSLQNKDWGGKINPAAYEDFDYKVVAHFSGDRTIDLEITRNELNVSLLESKYAEVFERKAMQEYPYRLEDFRSDVIKKTLTISSSVSDESLSMVGAFDFTFFFVKNSTQEDKDDNGTQKYPYLNVDAAVRKKWLKKFGGVRIYRDEFRVRPYGENGNDWLALGRRQAQSPGGVGQKLGGYRIRPNQISGVVSISRLTNTAFEDKSSREGIQENATFTLFKSILLQIIGAFELDRNTVMYNLSELYREQHPIMEQANKIAEKATVNNREDSLSNDKAHKSEIEVLAEGYRNLQNELRDRDAEVAMLRGLASMGISVATYTHELRSVMERLLPRTEMLKDTLIQYLPMDHFAEVSKYDNPYYALDLMHGEDEKLYNWLRYTLNSIQRSKRDRREIDLVSYLQGFVKAWKPALEKRHIAIDISLYPKIPAVIKGMEIDLDSIFNNFVANSVASLIMSVESSKKIDIAIATDHDRVVVDFIDNGRGLADEYISNPEVIFNAFETSVIDKNGEKVGTGMGLYIVKGIIATYPDAYVSILNVEKGFGIRVIFKIIKVSKYKYE